MGPTTPPPPTLRPSGRRFGGRGRLPGNVQQPHVFLDGARYTGLFFPLVTARDLRCVLLCPSWNVWVGLAVKHVADVLTANTSVRWGRGAAAHRSDRHISKTWATQSILFRNIPVPRACLSFTASLEVVVKETVLALITGRGQYFFFFGRSCYYYPAQLPARLSCHFS